MQYPMTYRCGHPDTVAVTGADRETRITRVREQFAGLDCAACRARDINQHAVWAADLAGYRQHADGLVVTLNVRAWHHAPYPGGGTWRSPGWEVQVAAADGQDELQSCVTRYAERYDEVSGERRLVAPSLAAIDRVVATLTAQVRSQATVLA